MENENLTNKSDDDVTEKDGKVPKEVKAAEEQPRRDNLVTSLFAQWSHTAASLAAWVVVLSNCWCVVWLLYFNKI